MKRRKTRTLERVNVALSLFKLWLPFDSNPAFVPTSISSEEERVRKSIRCSKVLQKDLLLFFYILILCLTSPGLHTLIHLIEVGTLATDYFLLPLHVCFCCLIVLFLIVPQTEIFLHFLVNVKNLFSFAEILWTLRASCHLWGVTDVHLTTSMSQS